MKEKSPTLKNQAKAIFIGNLVGTIFQFLVPAILVRFISQDDFGVYRQFQLVAITFLGLLGMGFSPSLFYFYPISDTIGRQKIIQQTQWLFLINIVIFSGIFYFYGNQILEYFNFGEFVDMKLYLVLFISFMVLSSILRIIFTLEKNTLYNKIYPSLEKIANFLIFVIVIMIIPGFKGPIIALLIFGAIRLMFFVSHISPYLKKIHRIDFKLLKEQLVYSLPFGLALILNEIAVKFDKFFINQYITPVEYGVYSLAFLSIPVLNQFFSSIHDVVVPQISIYFNKNQIEDGINLWKKTVEKTSSVTIPAVFLFWLLANEIITILYTVEYIEAANYYRIFVLIYFVSMFSHEIILRAANKTRFILVSNIIGTTLTILTGLYLIPKAGLYGAIITALLGTITPMIISLHIERKIMRLSFKNWVNWKIIYTNFLICFLISLPIFFYKDYITNIYLRTFIVGAFFTILVTLLQIRFNLFLFYQYIPIIKKYLRL